MSVHVLGTKGSSHIPGTEEWSEDRVQGRFMALHRPSEQHLPDRARRILRQHPEWPAHQQRRVHGPEHAAGDHGPHGRLHRSGGHLGHGPELRENLAPNRYDWNGLATGRQDRHPGSDAVRLKGGLDARAADNREKLPSPGISWHIDVEPPLLAWSHRCRGWLALAEHLPTSRQPGAEADPSSRSPA